MADFLVALAEFDAKKLWAELGHTSLWYYLHRELGLSKGAAQYRKTAVELVQRFPEVIEPLRAGKLCLMSVVELAGVITPDNREAVLPRFFHLSRQEAKLVAAELDPAEKAPQRDVVTVVRGPARATPPESPAIEVAPTGTVGLDTVGAEPGQGGSSLIPGTVNLVQPLNQVTSQRASASSRPVLGSGRADTRDEIEPLTSDLRRIHFTVSRRFMDKLTAARDALSHSRPGASNEQILEAGLDLVLAAHAKRNGLVERPLASPRPSKQGRYIPAHVRREVWKRDGGKCQWRLDSGEICGSTHQLEIDHVQPVALGGIATVEGCRVVCKPHNDLAARRILGDGLMDRFTRRGAMKPDRVREPEVPYGFGRRCERRSSRRGPDERRLGVRRRRDERGRPPQAPVSCAAATSWRRGGRSPSRPPRTRRPRRGRRPSRVPSRSSGRSSPPAARG
jgi:hypothetical protein